MLAAIPVLSRNTGYSLAHRGTVPHCHLEFFYSNKNNLVQLEDTTIKTERGCSMQRTERTTVAHHRSDFILSQVRRVSRADWREEWGETDKTSEVETDKTMAEEFQNEM